MRKKTNDRRAEWIKEARMREINVRDGEQGRRQRINEEREGGNILKIVGQYRIESDRENEDN